MICCGGCWLANFRSIQSLSLLNNWICIHPQHPVRDTTCQSSDPNRACRCWTCVCPLHPVPDAKLRPWNLELNWWTLMHRLQSDFSQTRRNIANNCLSRSQVKNQLNQTKSQCWNAEATIEETWKIACDQRELRVPNGWTDRGSIWGRVSGHAKKGSPKSIHSTKWLSPISGISFCLLMVES